MWERTTTTFHFLKISFFFVTYRYHCLRYPCNSFPKVSNNRILPSLQCKHTCIRHPLRCIVHYGSNHFRIQLHKKSTIYDFSDIFFFAREFMMSVRRKKRGENMIFSRYKLCMKANKSYSTLLLISYFLYCLSMHVRTLLICAKKKFIFMLFCECGCFLHDIHVYSLIGNYHA